MKVAIRYATTHGSTEGIAGEIAARLAHAGIQTDVKPIAGFDTLDGYDAVVVGSAIHDQAWLPEAAAFIRAHRAELLTRPVWLFSVSSVGDSGSFFAERVAATMRRLRREPKEVGGFRAAIRPRDHRNFAGAVERSHWDIRGHLFFKAVGGTYGDHRDWQDIDAWADGIARDLQTLAPTVTTSADTQ